MKIRNGFVSNSSSSSFILASKEESVKHVVTIEVDISKYTNKVVCNKKELDDFLKEECYYEPDEYDSEKYQNMVFLLELGYKVYFGTFSDETDDIEYFLCRSGLPKSINTDNTIIIENEGGY